MIPAIKEYTRVGSERNEGLWLDSEGSKKATIHQATVSFEEMGERTITTQVRIDGDIIPSFSGWELDFRGETFVLPTLKPQAAKDNTTLNSLVDLVFTSSITHDLKRYFFAEMSEIENGTMIIDKYVASLRLNIVNFVAAFNKVLSYYFPDGKFVMNLNPSYRDEEVRDFEIDYMYIWDVLQKFYEVYNVSWRAVTNAETGNTVIRVGYDMGSIEESEHIFEYGFEGGLLRFERHVEDTDIHNVLLGRGSEKNLPYRYFKDVDPYNPIWTADPDAVPELETVYFSRLLDSNFRKYIQGWRTNPLGELGAVDTYNAERAADDWAYEKGHTDKKFDPVEYVKDDESIAIYGVRQGKLDDNDDIYPTIQGVEIDGLGRVDEIVGAYVTEEESEEAEYDLVTELEDFTTDVNYDGPLSYYVDYFESEYTFVVPEGRVGNIEYALSEEPRTPRGTVFGEIDTTNTRLYTKNVSEHDKEYGISGLPAGTYKLVCSMRVKMEAGENSISGLFGFKDIKLHCTPPDKLSYRQVFTIWVKNIWQSDQEQNENDITYAHRIWDPILGDRLGKSAAVCFSSGALSVSSDYEFLIQKLPEVDRTKTINGVPSEWKITLVRSDAEYEATGLYIPNTKTGGLPVSGDYFFFTGIDIPFMYVKLAEEKLTKAKEDALGENAQTNPTWVISLDKIRVHEDDNGYALSLADKLDAGMIIPIYDKRFSGGKVLHLGVRSLSFTWNEPSDSEPYILPDIEVVLSDKIEYESTYDGVKREVNYISRNYATNTSVKKMARAQSYQQAIGIDGNICYFGRVIGTVEE